MVRTDRGVRTVACRIRRESINEECAEKPADRGRRYQSPEPKLAVPGANDTMCPQNKAST
jgi:hypothetical protein